MNINCYGYTDVYPVQHPLAGRKCLVISNFQNHPEYASFKGYSLTCKANSLVSEDTLEFNSWLTANDPWIFGESPTHTLIIPESYDVPKGLVFSVELIKLDLGGI